MRFEKYKNPKKCFFFTGSESINNFGILGSKAGYFKKYKNSERQND